MTARGIFITLEGGEGSGKSTQARLLAEHLRTAGVAEVVETREPGGTPGAEEIRRLLVTGAADRWDPWSEALLMIAARRDHVSRLIAPALDRGAWVICDRFSDSTLAYQGGGHGLPPGDLQKVSAAALGSLAPDMTLLIDLPVEEGLARAARRAARQASDGGDDETRFESTGVAFHQRVRDAFLGIAAADPGRVQVVSGMEAPEVVAVDIAARVAPILAEWAEKSAAAP